MGAAESKTGLAKLESFQLDRSWEELSRVFAIWVRAVEDQEQIEDSLTPEQIEFLDEYVRDHMEKRDVVVQFVDAVRALAKACSIWEARVVKRRRLYERMERWMLASLKGYMEMRGIRKAPSTLATIKLSKNPPSVKIVREQDIPAEYMDPGEPVPNKQRIKAALEEGKEVAGCVLITDRMRVEID